MRATDSTSRLDLPAAEEARPMRCLIVFCHPSETSFGAAILDMACTALSDAGHELRVLDLYRDHFDPVLSPDDWKSYLLSPERNVASVRDYVQALQWADALVLIFPTWMFGPPAMLKGWFERVWLPGVAFEVPRGRRARVTGLFRNVRRFIIITTSGSPWWWLRLIGDPCRGMMKRGFRVLFHPRCRTRWLQLYGMNHTTHDERQAFLERVRVELATTR